MAEHTFESLRLPDGPIRPREAFANALRRRLVARLGDGVEPGTGSAGPPPPPPPDEPLVALPPRKMPPMPTIATATVTVTPYLAVHDGVAALAFYRDAFDAAEVVRFMGDDGRLGHAEFTIGDARFYLSDEFPDLGVSSPRTLGGTSVTLHVEVPDVDGTFAQAVAAGATPLSEPADQPHGSRHGAFSDPFGHRWLVSQPIETLTPTQTAERMAAAGWTAPPTDGGIWSSVNALDAPAMIRFLVDVLGFEAELVVPGAEPGVIVHSQLRWPEGGGIVQVGSANRPGNPFSERPVGAESLYLITADPDRIYQRCLAVDVAVVTEPYSPDYDPEGSVFTVADPEGNLWSVGTYRG